MNRLLSLNVWVGVFSVLGVAGIILAAFGTITETAWARTTGFILVSPIVVTGILLGVVVIPILIVANRRHIRHTKHDYDEPRDDAQPM